MTRGGEAVSFSVLAFFTTYLAFVPNLSTLSWLISAIIFAIIINHKHFSTLFFAAIFTILSYTIYINFNGIHSHNNQHNNINRQIINYTTIYAKNNEITIIPGQEKIGHQALIYLNKTQSLIFNKNQNPEILKSQLQNEKNKLIFIFNDIKPCEINILEEYPKFFKNYKFLISIIVEKKLDKEYVFFNEEQILPKPTDAITYNVEIYIKN